MSKTFWLLLLAGVGLLDQWMRAELVRASAVQDVGPAGDPPEPQEPPPPATPVDPHPGFYRDRFGALTPLGCKRDRYGVVYVRDPRGLGWRELGEEPWPM